MKLLDFVALMEEYAPPSLALEYDNVGLLIGTKRREIKNVLVALDCTEKVAQEAADTGADLVLTHHPLFFKGIKRILPDSPETKAAYILIQNGIALYCAHTNLDRAQGGVNDVLAGRLGLSGTRMLPPENIGRVGDLPEVRLHEFAELVAQKLETSVRIVGDTNSVVRTAAVIGGGGDGDIQAAADAGANVLVTGEIRHHRALEALSLGISVIDAGHYETERIILMPLIEYLQAHSSGIEYNLTLAETAPIWCV
ncbi:MAG: putative GTP cyclohydrolase 1 type 2 [Firmicutes bacterium ADurb.Bin182]|nr:MAG: putative GTP cyclohydrolase 1 type 2 [Firmicutes bacterium ADurb.Bin182]